MMMENPQNEPLINVEHNSQSLKISKEIYLRILAKAVAQTREDIKNLEAALPVGKFDDVQAISHRLKGDYDNMRIVRLSSLAKELNEIVRTTQDKSRMIELVTEFKDYFQKLEAFLSAS